MEVNLSKTLVSDFNKKFQIGRQHCHFEFFGDFIAEANVYNYLGLTLSVEKNRFGKNHQRLKDKVLRAIYAARILTHRSMGNHITPDVLFEIHDSQIQPILDYGAEVWYQGKTINELEVVRTGFMSMKISQLHSMNNKNWCTIVFDILRSLVSVNLLETHVDQRMTGIDSFSSEIRLSLQNSYTEYWEDEIRNISKHPILRTY